MIARFVLITAVLLIGLGAIWAYELVFSARATANDPTTSLKGNDDKLVQITRSAKNKTKQDSHHHLIPVNLDEIQPSKQFMSQLVVQKFESALENRESSESRAINAPFDQIEFDAAVSQDRLSVRGQFGGVFLQAPHRLADKHTGTIVEKLADSTAVIDAFFINQRHRRELDYSRHSPNVLSDLSLSYLRHTERGVVVQIHGFAQEKRKSAVARDAHFILSSGHKGALKLPSKFSQCLQQSGFSGVTVFGKDVDELGATQNVVKRALHKHQFHRFLHIEMSLSQRISLTKSTAELTRFSECLAALVAI